MFRLSIHCSICKIDFNTLTSYVKHQHDLHSHSKNIRLICSCGGSFSNVRSLQTHWSRFHINEKEVNDEDMQQHEQKEDNDVDMIHPSCQADAFGEDVEEDKHLENESTNTSSTTEDLSEEELLKMFEKRVLYLLLTLQTVFYTSEAAIDFVISNLMELFHAISKANLV
ncbi:unnamed protein product [Rotaria sp. Silwood2]|nr:unnamed protein product [Rotaria sp. Silwood2]